MAAILFLALLVQILLQFPQKAGYELDEVTRERMQQREEYLTQQMNRLLQELEQQRQAQSLAGRAAPLLAALQQWQFWVLVLVLSFCWWLWKRIRQAAISSDYHYEDSSRAKDKSRAKNKSKTEDKYERRQSVVVDVRRASVTTLTGVSHSFPVVDKLVHELLCICQKHCGNSFMPLLQPAIGMGTTSESWGPHEQHTVYRMLVPLKAPRGHSFRLDLSTGTRMITENNYAICVELECTCETEQLEETMLCFLHHPKEKLRRNQGPSLLSTLCTGPYLDREKTNQWFQVLVKGASVVSPHSRSWQFKVLPSRCSCRIQMTNASGYTILVEMVLGVRRGYTFLSIE